MWAAGGHQAERVGRVALVAVVASVVAWTVLTVNPVAFLASVSYGAIGTLLAIRRPRNVIGWLLVALGILLAKPDLVSAQDIAAVAAGTASPTTTLLVWLEAWIGAVGYVTFLALAVLFPTGRLPSGPWRRPSIVTLMAAVGLVAAMAFAPTIRVIETDLANPYALSPLPLWTLVPNGAFLFLPLLAVVAAGVASLVVRHRQASGILRQQLRWLVTAIVFVLGGFAFGLVGSGITGTINDWPWLPAIVAYPMVPVAIGIAVFRYRLYDIDRILSRTLAYAIVTGIVAIVFGGAVVLLSAMLARFTQGQTIAVAASTLAACAVFQPVLHRVRRAVDRRFNRVRYDAEPAVANFSARLRNEVDIAAVTHDLRSTVQDAVHPTALGLWIRDAKI
jgi:hypothetical protein